MENFVNCIKARIDEITTSADIAFLPSGFKPVKKAIEDLACLKKEWNIEVLADKSNYEVNFENKLKIKVNEEHWGEFLSKILKGKVVFPINMSVNLGGDIKEEKNDFFKNVFKGIENGLGALWDEPLIRDVYDSYDEWRRVFGVSRHIEIPEVAFNLTRMSSSIKTIMSKIHDAYERDRGNLELLLKAIKDKSPLSAFDVFYEYSSLSGMRVSSELHDITLVLDLLIGFDRFVSSKIIISGHGIEEAFDELADLASVRIVGRTIYPLGNLFGAGVFKRVKDAIEDTT